MSGTITKLIHLDQAVNGYLELSECDIQLHVVPRGRGCFLSPVNIIKGEIQRFQKTLTMERQ